MKKVWVTALVSDEEKIGKLMGSLKQYGLAADGHFWVDDLKHMAWQAPAEELVKTDVALWIVVGSAADVKTSSVGFGLSLLAMKVFAEKGQGFPVIFASVGDVPADFDPPTLLKGAEIIPLSSASLGVKAVKLSPAKRTTTASGACVSTGRSAARVAIV